MADPQQGRPEAAAAIWRWRETRAQPGPGMAPARARLRGTLQALGGATFGTLSFLYWSRGVAFAAFGVSGLILLASLLSPTGAYAALHRLFQATGHAVGRAMTWLLMVPLFYLFFLPFGRLLRRGRRDRLKRWFDAEAETYWEPHPEMTAAGRERQF